MCLVAQARKAKDIRPLWNKSRDKSAAKTDIVTMTRHRFYYDSEYSRLDYVVARPLISIHQEEGLTTDV